MAGLLGRLRGTTVRKTPESIATSKKSILSLTIVLYAEPGSFSASQNSKQERPECAATNALGETPRRRWTY